MDFNLGAYRHVIVRKLEAERLPCLLGDERLFLQFSAYVFFVEENEAAAQDGYAFAVGASAGDLLAETFTAGPNLAYKRAEAEVRAADTASDTYGTTAFGQVQLPQKLRLDLVAGFSRTELETTPIQHGATADGDMDADAILPQARLSRSFTLTSRRVRPGRGFASAHISRDGFTLSDGAAAPSNDTDRSTISAGPSPPR